MELLPLVLGELSEELQGVGVDGLLGPGLRPFPGRRERDHVRAPVVGVPFALYVAASLEIVDQGHHRGAVDAQPLSIACWESEPCSESGSVSGPRKVMTPKCLTVSPSGSSAVRDLLRVFSSPAEDCAETTL